jgi:hypothetical protein
VARLDLIQFVDSQEYGLQEVDDDGGLAGLWNHEADQLEYGKRAWVFVRTLAEGNAYDADNPDDFWRAIEDVPEITPPRAMKEKTERQSPPQACASPALTQPTKERDDGTYRRRSATRT